MCLKQMKRPLVGASMKHAQTNRSVLRRRNTLPKDDRRPSPGGQSASAPRHPALRRFRLVAPVLRGLALWLVLVGLACGSRGDQHAAGLEEVGSTSEALSCLTDS